MLFHGLLEAPERYEEGTDELLQQLVSGQKNRGELTPQERELLNRATLEFAAGTRPTPSGEKQQQTPSPRRSRLTPPEEVELIYNENGPPTVDMDLPESPPTRWWER